MHFSYLNIDLFYFCNMILCIAFDTYLFFFVCQYQSLFTCYAVVVLIRYELLKYHVTEVKRQH